MTVSSLTILCIEICKTINSLLPNFMNDTFKAKKCLRDFLQTNTNLILIFPNEINSANLEVLTTIIKNAFIHSSLLRSSVIFQIFKITEICFVARYFQKSKNIL